MTKKRATAPEGVTKFQAFEMKRMIRKHIKNAPYNPRVISPKAAQKLKANLKKRGLWGPVTVNLTTGNLVAGHQRLAALDALEQNDVYQLDVATVRVSEKVEREQNVFMNNPAAMGDWDQAALASMLLDEEVKVDVEETGFDEMEMEILLGEKGKGVYGDAEQPDEVNEAVDDMEAALKERAEEAEAAKGRRQKIRETTKNEREAGDSERVAYVLFPNRKAREDWVESLGLERGERYVPPALSKTLRSVKR